MICTNATYNAEQNAIDIEWYLIPESDTYKILSSDNATITFKVDKEKLGDTKFEDLMFLWYDEKHDNFVKLETIQDEENGTLSVETTHFSKYMLVDSKEWFDNWRRIATLYEPYIKS